ncbi:MAG: tRNA pseudouridine(55) synthase TruB [Betaproteobacteria bacterium]
MDGVLNVNKPSGMTSHDVVLHIRRILKEKRIGHAGTLDPLATGVLVLCIGKATRIARYLEAGEKEYQAVMRLGITTDTLDAEGRVLATKTYAAPDRSALVQVMQRFVGTIMQRPPAFSAVKIAGVPSYKLAREGRTEPNKPRPVTIHAIELTAYDDPFVRMTVSCSKGVYIRSLCADIGDALGFGAHVTSLKRIRSGRFSIVNALTLEDLAGLAAAGTVGTAVTTIDDALADFPCIRLAGAEATRVANGGRISCPASGTNNRNGPVRLHDPLDRLLAIAHLDEGIIKPELVFSCGM